LFRILKKIILSEIPFLTLNEKLLGLASPNFFFCCKNKEVAHELVKNNFPLKVIFTGSKQTEIASYFFKKF